MNRLSLAVFAFAVDDMKARDSVITSASPFAFLVLLVNDDEFIDRSIHTFGCGTVRLV